MTATTTLFSHDGTECAKWNGGPWAIGITGCRGESKLMGAFGALLGGGRMVTVDGDGSVTTCELRIERLANATPDVVQQCDNIESQHGSEHDRTKG